MKYEMIKRLFKLPPKKIITILGELRDLRKRFDNGEDVVIPIISLHLKSGREYIGMLIDMEEENREQCIIFHLYDPGRKSPTYDVMYLNPRSIATLTLHNVAEIAHQFAFGSIPLPAPTKMEITRKAKDFGNRISEKTGVNIKFDFDWDTIKINDQSMSTLFRILRDCNSIILQLLDDETAREIISGSVETILLVISDKTSASLEEGVLKLSAGLPGEKEVITTRSQLKKLIEEAL